MDLQAKVIIAEKMSDPGEGLRRCGYYMRRGGDNPHAGDVGEKENVSLALRSAAPQDTFDLAIRGNRH